MKKIVYVNRIYTKNFVSDFIENLKNIVGGRLTQYEKMLDRALKECINEFHFKYPGAENLKVDIEQFVNASIMITITGEINVRSK